MTNASHQTTTKRRKPEAVLLRVAKGALVPADGYSASRLRAKGYHIGDCLLANLKKPRNPGFHRLAHRLGGLVAENIEGFERMDHHQVLKRLQFESGVGCEVIGAKMPGYGWIETRIPLSLSFESMDETEFKSVIRGLCRHIAQQYWPSMTPEQIEEMAEAMPEGEV